MHRIWLLFFCWLLVATTYCQVLLIPEVGKTYQFDIKNGSSKQGRLDSLDATYFYIIDQATGPDRVFKEGVSKIKEIRLTKNGFFANPHFSRHVFGPSAMPQPKGEVYWNNLLIEYNTVQYGVSDHLSVGMSTFLFTMLSGNLALMPNFKYSFKLKENRHLAVGALGFLWGFKNRTDETFRAALPFAVYTIGDSEANFSIGSGWLVSNEIGWSRSPTLYTAGSRRLSRNWVLQGEWFIPSDVDDINFFLLSMRYIKPVSSWDFGALITRFERSTAAIPVISYTIKF